MLKLFKGIKKQFKKNKYNYQNIQTMEKVEEQAKQYQWKKGENFGKVVEVKEVDGKFTVFTDGSRVYTNIMPEFMSEVIDGNLPFPGADQLNSVVLGESSPKANKIAPPINNTAPVVSQVEPNQPSPLEELVEKLSKKNIEPLETVINLNIPNRDIFNMLIDNADEDKENLIEAIAKVAVSQIEINKLQEYLTEEVTNFINNYYNE